MKALYIATVIGLGLCLSFCSKNSTETGNPGVMLTFSSYSTSSLTKAGEVNTAAVSQVALCFKRLRFKNESLNESSDNIDFEIGQITLDPQGGELASVQVPPGEYDRIEFDLEEDCEGQGRPSVIVDNDNDGGTPLATNDRITIKFEGQITISGSETIELAVDSIINALDGVTAADEIKDVLESPAATGQF